MDVEELRHLYVTQVLPWQPRVAPVGAVVMHDSSLIRTHYGTHGTIVHADVDEASDLKALVARQTTAFNGRAEPAEWTLLEASAPPHLAESLAAAGRLDAWVGADRPRCRGVVHRCRVRAAARRVHRA